MSTVVNSKEKKQTILSILSGTIVAISITLMLILLFALLIRFFNINEGWIFPINQIIKGISLFAGAIIFLKKHKQKGFFKGIILGLTYFLLSYIVFSVLQGRFDFAMNNFYDMILTTLMGGIVGIIVVNVIK